MPSKVPPILYKYCDVRGIDILQSHRLKVTPFDEFNDPFEIAPRMRPDFPFEDAKAAVTDPEFMRKLYETTNLLPPFQDFGQFSALIKSRADELAALSGETKMDASAIIDYFAPLKTWLDEQNKTP